MSGTKEQPNDVLAAVGALRIAVDMLTEQGVPLVQLLELVQGVYDARHGDIVRGKDRLRGAVRDALAVAGIEHAHQVAAAVAHGVASERALQAASDVLMSHVELKR